MTREPERAPPRHAHGDLTSLAPHERLPEILVVPREKTPTGAAARGIRPHRKSGVHNPKIGPEARKGWRVEALLSMISLRVSSADNGDYGVVVVQLLTFCNPMNFSRPSFLVIPYLLEFAQTQSIELVIPFNHLIICHPFLLLSIFPSIRVFSNQNVVYWKRECQTTSVFLPQESNEQYEKAIRVVGRIK